VTVDLATSDGPMATYEAEPTGAARGAVVVLQEAFGVNGYVRGVADDLAAQGYLAVAPALFHRTTDEPIPYGDHSLIMPHIAGLSDQGFLMDLDATLAHLAEHGFQGSAVGVVGFCIGGRMAFLAALERQLGATVTFYGGGIVTAPEAFADALPSLVGRGPELVTPWLGIFGDLDRTIPPAEVEELGAAAGASPVATEVVRYPQAGHAFHCSERPSFDADAAAAGWAAALNWLDRHLSR
jgi:carboxymethylenebutenolidase